MSVGLLYDAKIGIVAMAGKGKRNATAKSATTVAVA